MKKKVIPTKKKLNVDKKFKKDFIQHLGKYCPKCGAPRDESDLQVLGKAQKGLLLHVGCKKCGAQDVFHFMPNIGYSSAGGLMTDVSSKEAKSFFKSSKVTKDDVLDVFLIVRETENAKDLVDQIDLSKKGKRISTTKGPMPSAPSITNAA